MMDKKYPKGVAIIYHDVNHEARSREILECMELLCDQTVFVSYAKPLYAHRFLFVQTAGGPLRYIFFLWSAIQQIKKDKPDVVLLHDNLTSPVLYWLKKSRCKAKIIYDSSEYYLDMHIHNFKERIAYRTVLLEKRYLKTVDMVIAANQERAEMMRMQYKLPTLPVLFDNIHRIDEAVNKTAFEAKYAPNMKSDSFNIVYAGGISRDRRSLDLVKAVCETRFPCRLFIFGRCEEDEKTAIDRYLATSNHPERVIYLGYVSRVELKYVFSKAHISVSTFSQDTINHVFCASGKVYESLFEGIPILTSENPPLKRLCAEHGVGVSNDDFLSGIEELYNNYTKYKKNVEKYITEVDYENRVARLAARVRSVLHAEESK